MLLLARYGGLRVAEIAAVRGEHLDDDEELRVVGKGEKTRYVPIVDTELLDALYASRGAYLFPGRRKSDHLSPSTVSRLVSAALGPDWTGHTLRHKFATQAHRGTKDLPAVQDLLGHASLATTQIYLEVDKESRRAAVRAAQAA